jgi:hypothetical protein
MDSVGKDGPASAKLVKLEEKKPIRLGWLKGQIPDIGLDSPFFDPLPEDELRLWNGEGE